MSPALCLAEAATEASTAGSTSVLAMLVLSALGISVAAPRVWRRRGEILEPDPRAKDLFLLAGMAVATFLLFGFALSNLQTYDLEGNPVEIRSVVRLMTAFVAVAFSVLALWAVRTKVAPPRGTVSQRAGRALLVVWAALPFVMIAFMTMQAIGFEQTQESLNQIGTKSDGWYWVLLGAVVLAPVCEEVIFRGLLYPALRTLGGRPMAMFVTSAIFGAIHMIPAVIPAMVVFGFAMALIREWTGATWPCILAHFAFNAVNSALALAG